MGKKVESSKKSAAAVSLPAAAAEPAPDLAAAIPGPAAPAKKPVKKKTAATAVAAAPVETPAAPAKKPAAKKAAAKGTAAAKAPAAKKAPAKKSISRTAKAPSFSSDDIALRAYFIHEHRHQHGLPGDSHTDWVEAERQLMEEHQNGSK